MSFFYQIKFRAAWWRELKQLGYDVIPLSRQGRSL